MGTVQAAFSMFCEDTAQQMSPNGTVRTHLLRSVFAKQITSC